jgi:hypothetical protein
MQAVTVPRSGSLAGIWNSDEGFAVCSPSWEVLVLEENGTGRVEVFNFSLCSYDTFAWKIINDNTIAILGENSFQWDPESTSGFEMSKSDLYLPHLRFSIEYENDSRGSQIEMLKFDQDVILCDRYGKSTCWTLETYPLPEFSHLFDTDL